jgi:F1F0 ATPase subunit 2
MVGNLILLLFIGFLLGIFNFFGLRWTINRVITTKNTSIVVVSFILRMIIVCLVFFIFLNNNWRNAITMVIGFISIKYLIILFDKIRTRKNEYFN